MGCGSWVVGSCGGNTSTPQYTGITPIMGLWVPGCGLWVVDGHGGNTTIHNRGQLFSNGKPISLDIHKN